MNVHVPVTMAAMLVFLTCLTVTAVSGTEDNAIRREMLVMKQQINDLTALMADTRHAGGPVEVAFSVASHTNFGPVTVDTKIPYQVTYTNIGNGWNSATSSFQAPVDGLYEFSATLRSHVSSINHAVCHIVHTDSVGQTIMASMYGGFGENSGEVSGMANLSRVTMSLFNLMGVLEVTYSAGLTWYILHSLASSCSEGLLK